MKISINIELDQENPNVELVRLLQSLNNFTDPTTTTQTVEETIVEETIVEKHHPALTKSVRRKTPSSRPGSSGHKHWKHIAKTLVELHQQGKVEEFKQGMAAASDNVKNYVKKRLTNRPTTGNRTETSYWDNSKNVSDLLDLDWADFVATHTTVSVPTYYYQKKKYLQILENVPKDTLWHVIKNRRGYQTKHNLTDKKVNDLYRAGTGYYYGQYTVKYPELQQDLKTLGVNVVAEKYSWSTRHISYLRNIFE